jgi:hypothetical protein
MNTEYIQLEVDKGTLMVQMVPEGCLQLPVVACEVTGSSESNNS